MTLCIAHKNKKGGIEFWSDSRLNYSNQEPIDMAVKVVSYPIVVTEIKNPSEFDYRNDWGMCFAGGGQTIYYIKDFIIENLKNIEYSEDLFELTADKISEYINKIYVIACNKFVDKLSMKNGGCILLTTGLCPKDKVFKTYKYLIKYDNNKLISIPKEIFINDDSDFVFIGSGATKARELLKSKIDRPYDIMKKIIDEDLVSSVGGQIQFGETKNLDFKIKGVAKTVSNQTITQLRGVDLYGELFDYTTDLKPNTSFAINLNEIK